MVILILMGCSSNPETINAGTKGIPVPLGDPFIMLYDGTYYAYGTNHADGILVYKSNDLKEWVLADNGRGGLALHKNDSWADRWFWAPEVYYVNGKFYMYYSADEHICVATSTSPTGPFTQEVKQPMIADEKCIDNSLFIDDNGKAYLSFVRFNDGNNIWIAELEKDLITIRKETMRHCMHVSQEWETVWPRVNEGSFIVKHEGVYYMTYSANSYECPLYGVGYATANNVMGDWTKYDKNPILQKPGKLTGVGHSANFVDKEGRLRIVYHSHFDDKNLHPRIMHIGTINFVKDKDGSTIMAIDKEYLTPNLKR